MDEPILATDLSETARAAFATAYDALAATGPKLLVASYFGVLGPNLDLAAKLPVAGLNIDLVRAPDQLDAVLEALPAERILSLGVIDGRNVSFRLSAAGVRDKTRIHTYMCYSEFKDIMPAIAEVDADVISIETSRSDMELLAAFGDFAYPSEIGPGVWDIHSPRVPSEEEIVGLPRKALAVIPAERLWVNPDCGLKTRGWPETRAAIGHLAAAAHRLRPEARGAEPVV